jgi:hypothetical protein
VPPYRTPDPPERPGGRGSPYAAFILRLWREEAHGPWHASLQAAGSDRRLGFPDVEHLVAYLLRLTAGPDPSAGRDAPADRPLAEEGGARR